MTIEKFRYGDVVRWTGAVRTLVMFVANISDIDGDHFTAVRLDTLFEGEDMVSDRFYKGYVDGNHWEKVG